MIAIDQDRERSLLLNSALAAGRMTMAIVAVSSGPPARFDLAVAVPTRAAALGQELYVNVYLADLKSPTNGWNPRPPLIYPDVMTLAAPFLHTFGGLECHEAYVGVLASVCTARHQEVDWGCRIFRACDGREVRDCRRAG